MSQNTNKPKRYTCFYDGTVLADSVEDATGKWVEYSDYAALQAEVERLKAETVKQIEAALPPIEAYIAKLEAENERLRQAGDALVDAEGNWTNFDEAKEAWLAAKGVQP